MDVVTEGGAGAFLLVVVVEVPRLAHAIACSRTSTLPTRLRSLHLHKDHNSWVLNKMTMQPKYGSLGLVILSHISVFDIFSHVLPTCFSTYSIYLSVMQYSFW